MAFTQRRQDAKSAKKLFLPGMLFASFALFAALREKHISHGA
jgi:hypothetical protein